MDGEDREDRVTVVSDSSYASVVFVKKTSGWIFSHGDTITKSTQFGAWPDVAFRTPVAVQVGSGVANGTVISLTLTLTDGTSSWSIPFNLTSVVR